MPVRFVYIVWAMLCMRSMTPTEIALNSTKYVYVSAYVYSKTLRENGETVYNVLEILVETKVNVCTGVCDMENNKFNVGVFAFAFASV